MGLGTRLLLHRPRRAERGGGRTSLRRVRARPLPGLGLENLYPGVCVPVRGQVRDESPARIAVQADGGRYGSPEHRGREGLLTGSTSMSKELVQIDGTAPTPAAGRKLKAMLLLPPEWVPTAPYLALPSLTAVLRQHGHEVIQKDVNIEMYDLFFSDAFLIWVKARMELQLRELEAKERAGLLTDQETDQKACLKAKSSWDVFELAERAESAKRVVRGEEFYEADKLEWALNN